MSHFPFFVKDVLSFVLLFPSNDVFLMSLLLSFSLEISLRTCRYNKVNEAKKQPLLRNHIASLNRLDKFNHYTMQHLWLSCIFNERKDIYIKLMSHLFLDMIVFRIIHDVFSIYTNVSLKAMIQFLSFNKSFLPSNFCFYTSTNDKMFSPRYMYHVVLLLVIIHLLQYHYFKYLIVIERFKKNIYVVIVIYCFILYTLLFFRDVKLDDNISYFWMVSFT